MKVSGTLLKIRRMKWNQRVLEEFSDSDTLRGNHVPELHHVSQFQDVLGVRGFRRSSSGHQAGDQLVNSVAWGEAHYTKSIVWTQGLLGETAQIRDGMLMMFALLLHAANFSSRLPDLELPKRSSASVLHSMSSSIMISGCNTEITEDCNMQMSL